MGKKLFALSCVITLLLGLSVSAYAQENNDSMNTASSPSETDPTNPEIQNFLDTIEPYVSTSAEGAVFFDIDAAIIAGETDEIVMIGGMINEFSAAMRTNANDTMDKLRNGLPIWGNWCGPGHGGGATKGVLDAQCRTHDLCYGSKGYFACSCDKQLLASINRNYKRMLPAEKIAAKVVSTYFEHSACIPK